MDIIRDKELLRDVWAEAWAFGSHGSNISFDEWFAERFAKQIHKYERKVFRSSNGHPTTAST